MAKRRRNVSLDSLMAELSQLDTRRKQVVASIQSAVASVVGSAAPPFSDGRRRGRPAGSRKLKVARKKRKMSAAARKAISEAQKKRWAKQKASK
jgi:hypothetical protein